MRTYILVHGGCTHGCVRACKYTGVHLFIKLIKNEKIGLMNLVKIENYAVKNFSK
jgi:hypothetical protein